MSLLRRLAPFLAAGLLLLSAHPGLAQSPIAEGWSVSDDGLVFATNDTFDTPPGWTTVTRESFPSAISDIAGPDRLYGIRDTLETGTRAVSLHDSAGTSWLEAGHTPILARAVVGDGGASWLRQQHIISLPGGCPETWPEGDDCIPFDLLAELIDLAAPDGTPVGPSPGAAVFDFGSFASSGTVERDGTLLGFAGDASVTTEVRVRDDDAIVVRGAAEIGDGVGGRLRGYQASVVDLYGNEVAAPGVAGVQPLLAQARAAREAGASVDGVNRRVLRCPDSRRGWVVSQYLVNGVGRNVGPSVDPDLEGGIPVFVSEVIPFDCGAPPNGSLAAVSPSGGAAARVYCASARAVHRPFTNEVDGKTLTYSSFIEQLFGIVTLGIPPDADASLHARIGGANEGDIFSVGLEGVPLDSASHPDAVAWLGVSKAGIDTYGAKRFRDLELTADGSTFDLLEQQRDLFGEAFDVGPSQTLVTNCPGFDFTLEDVPMLFADGFESGDVSAWARPNAD